MQEAAYKNNLDYNTIVQYLQALHASVHEHDQMVAQIAIDVKGLSNAIRDLGRH